MGLGLSYCGGDSSTLSTSVTTTGTTSNPAVGGNVFALQVSDNSGVFTFDDLSDNEDVVLLLYSVNDSGISAGFEIGGAGSVSALQQSFMAQANSHGDDVTENFHSYLRELEATLNHEQALVENQNISYFLSQAESVGSVNSFNVLNSFNSSTEVDVVTATLRIETDNFQFYVDNRNSSALTDDELQELADQFESVVPVERLLFGDESDINGDGKFTVLFTQTVNELSVGSGGMVTGFFFAIDLFDNLISNGREIFYTFIPDPNGNFGPAISKSFATINIYPGVFSHEFQHLINFNMHFNVNNASAEVSWLNEGLAHLAEDIYSFNSDNFMTTVGLENPARVSSYFNSISNTCFTCGTSLMQRGGAYLFVRYFYEQAELGNLDGASSGADLLRRLLDTNLRGVDNIINAAFGSDGSDEDFHDIMGLFALAVYLSNADLTSDNRLGFTGINLRSFQNDNRGTVLSGPAVQDLSSLPFTDTLSGNSITFIQLSGETINNNGGSLEFTFGSQSEFGGFIIRE